MDRDETIKQIRQEYAEQVTADLKENAEKQVAAFKTEITALVKKQTAEKIALLQESADEMVARAEQLAREAEMKTDLQEYRFATYMLTKMDASPADICKITGLNEKQVEKLKWLLEPPKKTIRLLYPDSISGGLKEYSFGANLLSAIVPPNPDQPLIRVQTAAMEADDAEKNGIYGLDQVLAGIREAQQKIESQNPDAIITLGGSCLVSLAPFDYLHGKDPKAGIVWIDAHPDVSLPENGYPYAHAMVLGALLGQGDKDLEAMMKNPPFAADSVLYLGLQPLHAYQEDFLKKAGVSYQIQNQGFLPAKTLQDFLDRYETVFVHLDIDVLDPAHFHSTYFANPDLKGDGSGGGKMSLEQLSQYLQVIQNSSRIRALSIAEYLPFDEYRLHNVLDDLRIFH